MQALRILFPLFATLWFCGCASVAPFKGLTIADNSVYVAGLPPVHQDKHYACGAACVAAVAAYWNVSLDQFRAKRPQMPEDATGQDLQRLAEDLGLQAFVYRGSADDLRANLQQGRPMIVMIPQPVLPTGGLVGETLLNAWNQWGRKPAHWVIVVGVTKDKTVIIHDPESGTMEVKQAYFDKWWAQKSTLSVLITAS